MTRKLGKKVSAVGKREGGEKEKERLDFLARFQPSAAAFTRSPFFSFFKPSVMFELIFLIWFNIDYIYMYIFLLLISFIHSDNLIKYKFQR